LPVTATSNPKPPCAAPTQNSPRVSNISKPAQINRLKSCRLMKWKRYGWRRRGLGVREQVSVRFAIGQKWTLAQRLNGKVFTHNACGRIKSNNQYLLINLSFKCLVFSAGAYCFIKRAA